MWCADKLNMAILNIVSSANVTVTAVLLKPVEKVGPDHWQGGGGGNWWRVSFTMVVCCVFWLNYSCNLIIFSLANWFIIIQLIKSTCEECNSSKEKKILFVFGDVKRHSWKQSLSLTSAQSQISVCLPRFFVRTRCMLVYVQTHT